MSPDDGSGDGAFTRVVIAVVVVLGITTAGSLAKYKTDTVQDRPGIPAGGTPASTAPEAKPSSEEAKDPPFDSTGLLRPLWLMRRFLGAEPLFQRESSLGPTPFENAVVNEALAEEVAKDKAATIRVDESINGRIASPKDRAAIRTVVDKLWQQDIRSRVVVVTLPDWVDSSLQWTFDAMLDAIQMSAAQMGYVLTAFDLPDSRGTSNESPTPEKTARSLRRIHESVPGSLLFRRAEPGRPLELLLVLLVGETTTDGVHARALARALDLALIWNAQAIRQAPGAAEVLDPAALRPGGVPILGPTYSGSALSLRRGLEASARRNRLPMAPEAGVWFEVVTPSASNSANPSRLEAQGLSTFAAMTRSDDESLDALAAYMQGIKKEWRCGDGVALLVEATTAWGRGLLHRENAENPAAASDAVPEACEKCRDGIATAPFPCATYVPFPLHISRLRSEAQRSGVNADIPLSDSAVVRLDLDEPGTPIDRVAPTTPALTAAFVELMVSGLFRAIDDRKFSAIGVLATDKRDHVFLAQAIADHRPNVLPFTIESSLLYLHPDVRSYVRGTLVASTYSLNTRSQVLTNPARAQMFTQQFGGSQAHGAYNALALLLGEPEQMLDYQAPAGPGQKLSTDPYRSPPVWISVAAKAALLPLAAVAPKTKSAGAPEAKSTVVRDSKPGCRKPFVEGGYVSCVSEPASRSSQTWGGRYLGNPPLVVILAAVLFLFLAAHQAILSWGRERGRAIWQPTSTPL